MSSFNTGLLYNFGSVSCIVKFFFLFFKYTIVIIVSNLSKAP